MKILDTVGIDISKLKIDVRIHSSQSYAQFENSVKGFNKLIKWVYKNSSFSKENILFVFEHTGLYSYEIAVYLTEKEVPFSIVPGLEIKRSLGIARGKDDKVDATKIALYAYRLRDEIQTYSLPSEEILSLKQLLSIRELLVKQRAGLKASYSERKHVLVKKENKILFSVQERTIKYLSKQIKKVEDEIKAIIQSNDKLNLQYELITSIKGVGDQTTFYMIVFTHAFTKFDTWRKFASFCGIAPFPNVSGTSIRGKTKVSNLANKNIKSLLDSCAKSAIQYNMEMKQYYNKRVKEGKDKMKVINIIRNKIVSRIFAIVLRGTPYVNTVKYIA